MKYRPEIDGLRAIAVISVILFHAGFKTFEGGYIGVDIFFVISGYLITRIILKDLKQNTFSLSAFYKRRARRVLPPLFMMIFITSFIYFIFISPSKDEIMFHGQSILSSVFSIQTFSSLLMKDILHKLLNFRFMFTHGAYL